MCSKRFPALCVALGLLAAGEGLAVGQENRPSTQAVTGTFSGSPVNVKQRTCTGEDGPYLEIRGMLAGQVVSSDPRLTGELEFTSEPALVNLATGLGTFRGRFRVLDPETGAQTAEGEFNTVVTEGSLNHGLALGKLMGEGGAAERFVATFNSTFDAALNVTGQFGGPGDPRKPAVVQSGHCSGPFVKAP